MLLQNGRVGHLNLSSSLRNHLLLARLTLLVLTGLLGIVDQLLPDELTSLGLDHGGPLELLARLELGPDDLPGLSAHHPHLSHHGLGLRPWLDLLRSDLVSSNHTRTVESLLTRLELLRLRRSSSLWCGTLSVLLLGLLGLLRDDDGPLCWRRRWRGWCWLLNLSR